MQFLSILDVYTLISLLDTVVNAVASTVDTTKNVTASTADKSAAIVGGAKGS